MLWLTDLTHFAMWWLSRIHNLLWTPWSVKINFFKQFNIKWCKCTMYYIQAVSRLASQALLYDTPCTPSLHAMHSFTTRHSLPNLIRFNVPQVFCVAIFGSNIHIHPAQRRFYVNHDCKKLGIRVLVNYRGFTWQFGGRHRWTVALKWVPLNYFPFV